MPSVSKCLAADEVAKLHQPLFEARSTDGGWSWNKGGPRDPFTTGLAIDVLTKVHSGDDVAEIRDARKYLLMSQQPDGSWRTPSKNISNTTDPEHLNARDEIYHDWGTAWSAIGLLGTRSRPGK